MLFLAQLIPIHNVGRPSQGPSDREHQVTQTNEAREYSVHQSMKQARRRTALARIAVPEAHSLSLVLYFPNIPHL